MSTRHRFGQVWAIRTLYSIFDMLSLRFQETSSQHLKPKSKFKMQEVQAYQSSVIYGWSYQDINDKKKIYFHHIGLIKKRRRRKEVSVKY